MNFLPTCRCGGRIGRRRTGSLQWSVSSCHKSLSLLVPPGLLVLRTASEKARPKANDLSAACPFSHSQGAIAPQTWSLSPGHNWTEDRIILIVLHFSLVTGNAAGGRIRRFFFK